MKVCYFTVWKGVQLIRLLKLLVTFDIFIQIFIIELFQPFQYNHQWVSERSDEDNRLGCSGTGKDSFLLSIFIFHICIGIVRVLRSKKQANVEKSRIPLDKNWICGLFTVHFRIIVHIWLTLMSWPNIIYVLITTLHHSPRI